MRFWNFFENLKLPQCLNLEQNMLGPICKTIWVEYRNLNRTLENKILKLSWKAWSTIVFWIFISEQNMLGLIGRTI